MKVIEDVQDKYGNYCIIFKSTNLRLIYDWLHTHYSGNGFKFAIVIDLSIDYDYEEPTETSFMLCFWHWSVHIAAEGAAMSTSTTVRTSMGIKDRGRNSSVSSRGMPSSFTALT